MLSIFSLLGFVGTMFGQSSVNHRLYYRDADYQAMSFDNVRRDDTNGDGNSDFQTAGGVTQLWEVTASGLQLVAQPSYGTSFTDAIKWGDFNNDGLQDIVYGDWSAQMFIAYGESTTTFSSTPINIGELDMNAWGASCYGASTGDYNGDGWLDIVGQGPNMAIFLFTNNQDGTFTRSQVSPLYSNRYSSWSRSIDWDSDGDLDMLAVVYEGLALYTNEGESVFTESILFAPSHYLEVVFPGVTMNDLDNDGDLDFLVSANSGTYVGSYPEGYTEWYGWSSIFVNNGSGFTEQELIPYNALTTEFETPTNGGNYYYTRRLGNNVRIEDLNDDGYKDIISTTGHSFNMSLFYGGPDLSFTEQIYLSNNSAGPAGAMSNSLAEDITGDGILDFVVKHGWWNTIAYVSEFKTQTVMMKVQFTICTLVEIETIM